MASGTTAASDDPKRLLRLPPGKGDGVHLVYVTAPPSDAKRIARALIARRVAACVNMLQGESVYEWQGEVEEEAETLLLIKTSAGSLEALRAAVNELHPYDVPEFLVVDAAGGSAEYLDWVRLQTAAGKLPKP